LQGEGVRDVARLVGASRSSVFRWKQQLERGGLDALRAKPHPGRRPRLTAKDKRQLEQVLLRGALEAGFPADLWTLARVAELIERELGVRYHPGHVWRILTDMGWSCRKPESWARERDEVAIARWR
jgi:transposase